jgi:hypothetical protein
VLSGETEFGKEGGRGERGEGKRERGSGRRRRRGIRERRGRRGRG